MTCSAPELSAFLKTLDKNLSFRARWDGFSFISVWPSEMQVERREKKTKKWWSFDKTDHHFSSPINNVGWGRGVFGS